MPCDAWEANVNLREAIAHMTYDTRVKRRARALREVQQAEISIYFEILQTFKKTDRYK